MTVSVTFVPLALAAAYLLGQAAASQPAASQPALYSQDFEAIEVGKAPDDFLIIDGAFAVQPIDGNKVLELPATPLDNFGLVFGPTRQAGVAVQARIFGTTQKRRSPIFAIGLGGQTGYQLRLAPARDQLELVKAEHLLKAAPITWKSGTWVWLKLQVLPAGSDGWKVQGKCWPDGTPEPAEWQIEITDDQSPPSGRASLWGSPFSETPIRYDDLRVIELRPTASQPGGR